jgi:hypothetical protein
MTRKTLISQLRQVDNGENNAITAWEVVNQTMAQMRDNIKFNTSVKTGLEKFYKDIRKDLGLNDMQNQVQEEEFDGDEQTNDNMVVDSRK